MKIEFQFNIFWKFFELKGKKKRKSFWIKLPPVCLFLRLHFREMLAS